MSTMVARWVQDRKKNYNCNVVGFSQVGRVTVVRQSCDNRTTIVSCLGLFFRFLCQWMRVLLSCHCLATVMRLSTKALETYQAPSAWIQRNHQQIPPSTLTSVYLIAQTSSAVRSMDLPSNVGRVAGSYTVHGFGSTIRGPYFALVVVRQGAYLAGPSTIFLMK